MDGAGTSQLHDRFRKADQSAGRVFVWLPLLQCACIKRFACVSWLKSQKLCAGHQPFHDVRPVYAIIIRVVQGVRPSRPDNARCFGAPCSDDLWALTERCWHQDPDARPFMAVVLEHFELISQPSQQTGDIGHPTEQSVLTVVCG